jgi:hypothetical protein
MDGDRDAPFTWFTSIILQRLVNHVNDTFLENHEAETIA